MPNASKALLQMEQGATLLPFAAMVNSGDQKIFTAAALVFSGADGKEPDVRPNGIVTGLNLVTPAASLTNNLIDCAAFTAYSMGVLKAVAAATDETVTRPTTNKLISSITMTSAGAIAVIAGTEGTDFVETRAAAGGPPEIPADSVEIAQVRLDSPTAAPIVAAEILQVVGQHSERYDVPVWKTPVNGIGEGLAAKVAAKANAHVEFVSALPLTHTGGTPKKVYIQLYEPIFADVSDAVDFVPVETTHSVSTRQVYGRTVGSDSESLGQGGFSALVNDGINDALSRAANDRLTFKFFPDQNKSAYRLTQGKLGIKSSYPAAADIEVKATISARDASASFSS